MLSLNFINAITSQLVYQLHIIEYYLNEKQKNYNSMKQVVITHNEQCPCRFKDSQRIQLSKILIIAIGATIRFT